MLSPSSEDFQRWAEETRLLSASYLFFCIHQSNSPLFQQLMVWFPKGKWWTSCAQFSEEQYLEAIDFSRRFKLCLQVVSCVPVSQIREREDWTLAELGHLQNEPSRQSWDGGVWLLVYTKAVSALFWATFHDNSQGQREGGPSNHPCLSWQGTGFAEVELASFLPSQWSTTAWDQWCPRHICHHNTSLLKKD